MRFTLVLITFSTFYFVLSDKLNLNLDSEIWRANIFSFSGGKSGENYTLGTSSIQTLTRKAEGELESIIHDLKSFIQDLHFEGHGFEIQASKFDQKLSELSCWVETVFLNIPYIIKRFKFATHMFQVMRDATEYVKFYNLQGVDQYLVRRVIQLNVRLLSFYDSWGYPDPSITGYNENVFHFTETLRDWGKRFNSLTEVPLSVQLMFESEYVKASIKIQELSELVEVGK